MSARTICPVKNLSIFELRAAHPGLRVVAVVGGFRCDVLDADGVVVASSGVWPARGCSAWLPWTSGMLAAREAATEAIRLSGLP